MKKKYIILGVVLLLVAGAVILFMLTSNSETEGLSLPAPRSGDAATPHFTLYDLRGTGRTGLFHRFVQEPSLEILNRAEGGVYVLSLTETQVGQTGIQVETITVDPPSIVVRTVPMRIGTNMNIIVCESLIRFAGNTEELQTFLAEHGVTDEIEYIAVVNSASRSLTLSSDNEGRRVTVSPFVIWVQAGGESFFIGVESHTDGFGDPYGTRVYEFFTRADYLELFEQRVRENTFVLDRLIWGFGY